jgi:hypothetical protein
MIARSQNTNPPTMAATKSPLDPGAAPATTSTNHGKTGHEPQGHDSEVGGANGAIARVIPPIPRALAPILAISVGPHTFCSTRVRRSTAGDGIFSALTNLLRTMCCVPHSAGKAVWLKAVRATSHGSRYAEAARP